MKRRAVLASLGTAAGVSITGCTQVSSIPSPNTDRRVVELESVDDVPVEHSVEMTVEVLEPTIDAEHSARIEVSTTNTGERRALSVSPGMCALFNRNRSGSDHLQGLWLYRAGSTSNIDRKGDRWVADRPSDEPRVYPSYGCLPTVYDTGDAVSNEYVIWDDYRHGGYMDSGTYRWEERVNVSSADSEGEEDDDLGSFHWGFEIDLAVPDDA